MRTVCHYLITSLIRNYNLFWSVNLLTDKWTDRFMSLSFCFMYLMQRTHQVRVNVQGDTKKRELLKNPTKIEEIQEKQFIDRT